MPSSIGTLVFHSMSMPQFLSTKVNFLARTGVDGYAVWSSGYRGEAFNVTTFKDYDDFSDAFLDYQTVYLKMRGTVQTVLFEDPFIGAEMECAVVDVQPTGMGIRRILAATGGTVGSFNGNGAVVEARWTLLGLYEIFA